MNISPQDQLYLWNGLLLYLGHGPRSNDWHSHYAASLLICPDAPLRVEAPDFKADCMAVLLPPNTENRIHVEGRLLVLMIDPDAQRFAALAPLLGHGPAILDERLQALTLLPDVEQLFDTVRPAEQTLRRIDDLIEQLSGLRPEAPLKSIDPRIANALQVIQQALPEEVPVEQLATNAGLSKSRFLHLFKEQLGLPMRQYLLWRRLYETVRLWDEGMTMTDAAHAAGFYDQAHYTRTMRRMLDVTPSQFANNPQLNIHHAWRDEAGMQLPADMLK